ncbi:MAG: helix-turn-helix transcriptional regulator [Erysipelotrichaceae bacterium]|nr:helix-turn-helix transcriptional regulator [Erysipelotrichaceae bacterium]MBQ7889770.1 helix-turn-helix transcriptional regulator [Erysipelotrichaceae bacterium]
MQKIGSKLRKLRKAKNLTVKEVAAMTGFSASFIYAVEQERKNPCYENIQLLCEKLDVPPIYFFDDSKSSYDIIMENGAMEIMDLLLDYDKWPQEDKNSLKAFINYQKSKKD